MKFAFQLLAVAYASQKIQGFQLGPGRTDHGRRTAAAALRAVAKDEKKKIYIQNERQAIAKKKDFYRGAGVFKNVKAGVEQDMRKQFDSVLMNEMKEDPNYMLEKDGVEFYLAKDHGFCWGGELSKLYSYQ